MAANQTIIQAAEAAYTKPKVDISGQVKAMAAISEMVVKLGEEAKKKMDELNKEFNLLDFMDKPQLEAMMTEIRNDKSLSQEEKIAKFKGYKNSMNILETWSLTVGDMIKNEEISQGMDSDEKAWLSTIVSGKFYGPHSLQDKDNDGEISDEEASALAPIRMNPSSKKLQVLGRDGKYVNVDKLQGSFLKKTDSNEFGTAVRSASSKITKGQTKDQHINESMVSAQTALETNSKANKSAKYDQRFNMGGLVPDYKGREPGDPNYRKTMGNIDGGQTFVEHYLENWDGWEVDQNADLLALINGYNAAFEGSKAQREFGNNIFRTITANEDTDKEFLKFIRESMEYSLKDLK